MSSAPFDSFGHLADALGELEVTVGPSARPAIAAIRRKLLDAAAARGRGDAAGGMAALHQAMEQLTVLAGKLDPEEGALMKLIAQRFTDALAGGDRGVAKESVNFIRRRAGDVKDDPSTDW